MGQIILSVPPSGFDGAVPAGLDYENNVPKILFDDTTAQSIYWQFRMDDDYASTPVIKLPYSMFSATSGIITLEVAVWATSDTERADVPSYDSVNSFSETVPGTAGNLSDISIALTNNDSLAGGDLVRIRLARNIGVLVADNLQVWAGTLDYTTT